MKRTSMIAAAVGTAAVLGLAGTAVAANAGTGAPATVKASPAGDDNGLRGDGTVDDSKSASVKPSSTARYDMNQSDAARAALKVTGGGTVTKIEAEYEHGRPIWKVRIVVNGKRHDVRVDRYTGKVTRHDVKSSND